MYIYMWLCVFVCVPNAAMLHTCDQYCMLCVCTCVFVSCVSVCVW